jgi:Transcription elongation factor Elf1 like
VKNGWQNRRGHHQPAQPTLIRQRHQSNDIFNNSTNRPKYSHGKEKEVQPKGAHKEEGTPCTLSNIYPISATDHITQLDGLPIIFSCLFCNHERSVTVKMDKKAGIGQLTCKVCGQNFQTDINCT